MNCVRTGPFPDLTITLAALKEAFKAHVAGPSAIVLDVDDTLTLGEPSIVVDGHYLIRPGVLELLKFLQDVNIKIIISSAHIVFEETLTKLEDIHIFDFLGITPIMAHTQTIPVECKVMNTTHFGWRKNNVISVRNNIDGDLEYRDKAIALLAGLSEIERSTLQTVFFIDDQPYNHSKFIRQIQNHAPSYYPDLQWVQTFELMHSFR